MKVQPSSRKATTVQPSSREATTRGRSGRKYGDETTHDPAVAKRRQETIGPNRCGRYANSPWTLDPITDRLTEPAVTLRLGR